MSTNVVPGTNRTVKWDTIKKDMKRFEKEYGKENVVVNGRTGGGDPVVNIYSKSINDSKVNEGVTPKDILKTIKAVSKQHKTMFANPFLMHEEPTHIHKKLGPVKIHPGVRAYNWRKDGKIAVSTSLQGSKDWNFTGVDLKDLSELPKNHKLPKQWLSESKLTESKKFKAGDMWSDDFDYDGMLSSALKVNINTPIKQLKDLHASLTDVNYHTVGKNLGTAIELIEDQSPQEARAYLKRFHIAVKAELKEN